MSLPEGLRDPMAWVAIGLASVVLVTGLILTTVFDPAVPTATERPTSPPPSSPVQTESPSPLETETPTPPVETPSGVEGPITPSFADASDSAPPVDRGGGRQDTYEATNAVDDRGETAWCVAGDGVDEYLVLGFDGSVGVTEIALIPGYDKIDPETGADRFEENRKILRVRFTFDDGSSYEQTFDPPTRQLAPTTFPEPVQTEAVVISVEDTTEPSQANRDYTCISTVRVRGIA